MKKNCKRLATTRIINQIDHPTRRIIIPTEVVIYSGSFVI